MKGVKHYTKNGKKWTGASHKMDNGTLHTGKNHTNSSKPLVHKKDLKKGPFKMNYSPLQKKKGLDGKACWKGYTLRGTKKKGGKTVDNCVKTKK